ncbi:MAG: hypothetical protein ABSG54_11030 [Terriglobia bacterium]|jgi:hypothetical protein
MMLIKRLLVSLGVVLSLASWALASDTRWLHVRVEDGGQDGEIVRVNLPLSLAEKVLPAIHTKEFHEGKVKVSEAKFKDVDIRAILEALRTAPENDFVSVQGSREDVRVAKSGGNLLVKVREAKDKEKGKTDTVEVSIPFAVVDALLSGSKDELDVLAAVRALGAIGDTVLVTVNDKDSKVRIWVDARNNTD